MLKSEDGTLRLAKFLSSGAAPPPEALPAGASAAVSPAAMETEPEVGAAKADGPPPSALESALRESFLEIDHEMRAKVDLPEAQLEQTGCTAVAAVLTPRVVVCAWVGDSRCVVGTHGGDAGGTVSLSSDHKPQHEKENERIQSGGGHVFRGRVNGMLAVSRALGDYFYKANAELPPEKQLVSCVPDSRVHARHDADEFVILACDGVWDVCTNEQACAFVRAAYLEGVTEPGQISKRLIEYCLLMGSRDNMTAIVLLMNVEALRASGEREAAERAAAADAWTKQAEAAAADPKATVLRAPSSKEEIERLPISIPAALYAHKVWPTTPPSPSCTRLSWISSPQPTVTLCHSPPPRPRATPRTGDGVHSRYYDLQVGRGPEGVPQDRRVRQVRRAVPREHRRRRVLDGGLRDRVPRGPDDEARGCAPDDEVHRVLEERLLDPLSHTRARTGALTRQTSGPLLLHLSSSFHHKPTHHDHLPAMAPHARGNSYDCDALCASFMGLRSRRSRP